MYIFVTILILVICVLLSLVVLVQNPKGGGLNQSLGGVSNQVFGAKRSGDLVEKVTWYLASAIVVLSLLSALFINTSGFSADTTQTTKSKAESIQEKGVLQNSTTVTPTEPTFKMPEPIEETAE